jgi:hypothetical protein
MVAMVRAACAMMLGRGKAVHHALAGVVHQFDGALLAGLEAHGRADAMFSRMPRAAARSKRSAALVSAKW